MNVRLSDKGSFRQFVNQVDAAIDEMLVRGYARYCPTESWRPRVNVYETDTELMVCVDLAGMNPDQLVVDVQGTLLLLRGSRPHPQPPKAGKSFKTHLMEIDAGDFCREIELPEAVDRDAIGVEYREGFLWITLPRRA